MNDRITHHRIRVEGLGKDPGNLILEAQKRIEHHPLPKPDQTWVVFDKDKTLPEPFNEAVRADDGQKFRCAWSNPCFERWFVLHFQWVESKQDAKSLVESLQKSLQPRLGRTWKYEKNDPKLHSYLKEYGSEINAMKHARKLDDLFPDKKYAEHNPRSQVHQLLDALNRLP